MAKPSPQAHQGAKGWCCSSREKTRDAPAGRHFGESCRPDPRVSGRRTRYSSSLERQRRGRRYDFSGARAYEASRTTFPLSTTAYEAPWKRRGGPLHLSEGMYRVVPKIGKFEAGAREDRTRHTSKQSDKLAFLNHLSSYRLPVGPGHKDIVSLPDTGKQSEIL